MVGNNQQMSDERWGYRPLSYRITKQGSQAGQGMCLSGSYKLLPKAITFGTFSGQPATGEQVHDVFPPDSKDA